MSSSPPKTRPATLSDADAVAELFQALELEILGRAITSATELPAWWAFTDPPTGSWLVERDGRLDGAAWLGCRDAWDAFLAARPGHRELEAGLLDLAEANDFDGPPAEPVWPDWIHVAVFHSEDARAFHDAANEAFAGDWGFRPLSFEEWRVLRVDDSDTSLYWIAWDRDEIAGYLHGELELSGFGNVGMLGVRPAWRGRGIGEALLRHAFGEFHRRGMPGASLGVDSENPTGATRLYERVGMRVASEAVVYERALR